VATQNAPPLAESQGVRDIRPEPVRRQTLASVFRARPARFVGVAGEGLWYSSARARSRWGSATAVFSSLTWSWNWISRWSPLSRPMRPTPHSGLARCRTKSPSLCATFTPACSLGCERLYGAPASQALRAARLIP